MNFYERLVNKVSNQEESNKCMVVKLKYEDKWLQGGTPCDHPIYIAYEEEFNSFSYNKIRKEVRKKYKNLDELKNRISELMKDNAEKYFKLFNEDIKYNNR